MKIGMHVRLVKGLLYGVERAHEIGCETMQIFASNPNAWSSSPMNPSTAIDFYLSAEEAGISPVVIHTPYLLNLASPDEGNYTKTVAALADSMRRAEMLHADFVVTHIGSHRGTSFDESLDRITSAVNKALEEGGDGAVLLLENSSGSGDSVGASFEELNTIMDQLTDAGGKVGICLDTAHMWGAGYDLSGQEPVDNVLKQFDKTVGLDRLRLLHLNDTNVPLGSRKDRHANIGTGKIGIDGIRALINHPDLADLAGIAETPPREDKQRDIDILKSLRKNF